MASGQQRPCDAAKMRRRLDTVTAELARIKKTIDCADAEILRFWLYHLELQDRATRLADVLERLKNQRSGGG